MTMKAELLFGFVLGLTFNLVAFSAFKEMGGLSRTVMSYFPGNGREDVSRSVYAVPCNNSSVSGSFMNGMEWLQNERKQMLRLACSRYSPTIKMNPLAPNAVSLYNNKYSFSICRINKVASSSWLRAVMVADGFYTKRQMEEEKVKGTNVIEFTQKKRGLGSLKVYRERLAVWKNSTNIITVRDPLSRILSAYVDKMVRCRSPVFAKIRSYVLATYRGKRANVTERGPGFANVTFEDFVNFLVDPTKRKYKNDAHWRSYYSSCMPCTFQYDVIMKLETLSEDSSYLHGKLNVSVEDQSLIIPGQPASNRRDAFPGGNISVSDYYDRLPPTLRKAVYDKYRFDFDAFGYEPPT